MIYTGLKMRNSFALFDTAKIFDKGLLLNMLHGQIYPIHCQ